MSKTSIDEHEGIDSTRLHSEGRRLPAEDVAKPSVRPKTYESYEHLIRVHILPDAIAKRPLSKLNLQDVQSFLNRKLASNLSSRTVQYLHAVIRRAREVALKWGLVVRNVAKLADPPRVKRQEVNPLAPEQAKAFLEAAKEDRLYAMYVVALALGLRQGELFGLRWQDWGLVFTSTTGTPLDPHNIYRSFGAILARANLPRMRFHDLRHSCASLLLAQGMSPRVIMETLGHSQISLTMNTYAHVMPALQREAADAMDKLLGK